MTSDPRLAVRFWGVRGSIPTPDRNALEFGGNTACVEISYGNDRVIIDAGTGIRALSKALPAKDVGEETLLFTHFHWDHIQGLPFFPSLYQSDVETTLASACPPDELEQILNRQMLSPYFPTTLPRPPAVGYRQVPTSGFSVGAIKIFPFPLHHADATFGYRLETPDGVVVHASDHEHGNEARDAGLREHAANADLLIFDAQYTPEEYEEAHGWGHSTWLEGTNVARDAGVKRLALFHHNPEHTDDEMERIEESARAVYAGTFAAREGRTVSVSEGLDSRSRVSSV